MLIKAAATVTVNYIIVVHVWCLRFLKLITRSFHTYAILFTESTAPLFMPDFISNSETITGTEFRAGL